MPGLSVHGGQEILVSETSEYILLEDRSRSYHYILDSKFFQVHFSVLSSPATDCPSALWTRRSLPSPPNWRPMPTPGKESSSAQTPSVPGVHPYQLFKIAIFSLSYFINVTKCALLSDWNCGSGFGSNVSNKTVENHRWNPIVWISPRAAMRTSMVVGAVIDDQGKPICCEMRLGNTADVTTLIPNLVPYNILCRCCHWHPITFLTYSAQQKASSYLYWQIEKDYAAYLLTTNGCGDNLQTIKSIFRWRNMRGKNASSLSS